VPNGLVRLAYLIAEDKEEIVFMDESLSFTDEGTAIKEYVDNFKMDLEVITKTEAKRRKKATTADQSNPSTPSAPPSATPGADPWQGTIKKAREILESGLSDSKALANYIECAHSSMQEKQDLKNTVDQIKQQLSTGRGKVEDPDTACPGCSQLTVPGRLICRRSVQGNTICFHKFKYRRQNI
jgi:hypothetical protein